MKRKSTRITAKYNTICPICMGWLKCGQECKVHTNKWLHLSCYGKFVIAKNNRQELQDKYFGSEQTTLMGFR